MTFNLNNNKTIICDELFVLDTNISLSNVLDLIANSSGGGGVNLGGSGIVQSAILPLSITNGVLSTLWKPTNVTSGTNSGIDLLQEH